MPGLLGGLMSKTKEQLLSELAELEELKKKVDSKKSAQEYKNLEVPFKVGGKYLIRTVTYFATGQVKAIVGNFLVLENAACVFDTGNIAEALAKGVLSEVETVGSEMFINMSAISDAFVWTHNLP
jgi:hypothetical protein